MPETNSEPRLFTINGAEVRALLQRRIDSIDASYVKMGEWITQTADPRDADLIAKARKKLREEGDRELFVRDHIAAGDHFLTATELESIEMHSRPHAMANVTLERFLSIAASERKPLDYLENLLAAAESALRVPPQTSPTLRP